MVLFVSCDKGQRSKIVIDRYEEGWFENSHNIGQRKYRVYLPHSYSDTPTKSYPILYMMDGQNLFFDELSYSGIAWRIQHVSDSLVQASSIREFIIVGIDHAGEKRFSEYLPQKPFESLSVEEEKLLEQLMGYAFYSDDFLRFLVTELKPKIDSTYRTLREPENTFVGGSSMGGLIAMYAVCEYPEVFGGAICMSTHWPILLDNANRQLSKRTINYFSKKLPLGKKWYFDLGSEGLDRFYAEYQDEVDAIMRQHGYGQSKNWLTKRFEGDEHNERSWHRRLHIPLQFMFGNFKEG